MSSVFEGLLSVAGVFLILILCTESFQQSLAHLKALLQQRPRLKYLVYPLGALLFLGVAALMVNALVNLAANRFSYE